MAGSRKVVRITLKTLLVFCGACVLVFPLHAGTVSSDLRLEADQYYTKGQWGHAALKYSEMLSQDRNDVEVRERYQLCLRHIHQARRLRDADFQRDILNQKLSRALEIYAEVLFHVKSIYVDEKKATPSLLFRHGVQEFLLALEDPLFISTHLARFEPTKIRRFAQNIEGWLTKPISSIDDARKFVHELTLDAIAEFQIGEAVVILEFAYGACNALDEYTVCLTPAQYRELLALQKGEFVGVGIDLMIEDQKLLVARVYPDSPAAGRLQKGDRIVGINGKPVDRASAEVSATQLRGPAGSVVEMDVIQGGDGQQRTLKLERQVVAVHTVDRVGILDPAENNGRGEVGYARVTGFNKETIRELKEAVILLHGMGMKGMILDLRGNGGGSFPVAVEAAELFLTGGLIATTQSRLKEWNNKQFKANNPKAFDVPLVVLVDGGTASAAEVFVAALKENKSRAYIVGRSTFGKNSMQCLIPLKQLTGGMRITVARFYPPSNQDFSGRGIDPDHLVLLVDGLSPEQQAASELNEALAQAKGLLMMIEQNRALLEKTQ